MKCVPRPAAVALILPLEPLESRRLLSGGLDPTFGVGGIVAPQTDAGAAYIDAILPLGGTAFVALGYTEAANPLYLFRFDPATGRSQTVHINDARLASVHVPDPTSQPRHDALFLACQSSGKIILAWLSDTSYDVARFIVEGTLPLPPSM